MVVEEERWVGMY